MANLPRVDFDIGDRVTVILPETDKTFYSVKFYDFDGEIFQEGEVEEGHQITYPTEVPDDKYRSFRDWATLDNVQSVSKDVTLIARFYIKGCENDDLAFVVDATDMDRTMGVSLYADGEVATIDWGDGTVETVNPMRRSHNYASNGVYIVRVNTDADTLSQYGSDTITYSKGTQSIWYAQLGEKFKNATSSSVFRMGTRFEGVSLPTSIENFYGANLFTNSYSLRAIVVTQPVKVSQASYSATNCFADCRNLRFAMVNFSTDKIPDYYFSRCCGLERVILSENVTAFGSHCFDGTVNLEKLDGVGAIKSGKYHDGQDNYGRPAIREQPPIADNASNISFEYTELKHAVLKDGMAQSAFTRCQHLQDAEIDADAIVAYAFAYCLALRNVSFKRETTSIGSSAFQNCEALEEIDIPTSVTSIGAYAFSNCRSLRKVEMHSSTPPTLGAGAFQNITTVGSTCLRIVVPEGSAEAYKTATNWSSAANFIVERVEE